jgi:hypothetical protein
MQRTLCYHGKVDPKGAIKPRIASSAASLLIYFLGWFSKTNSLLPGHTYPFRSSPQPFVILAAYGTFKVLSLQMLNLAKPQVNLQTGKHAGPDRGLRIP